VTQMKPQFQKVVIDAEGNLDVEGPIDFFGSETFVSVWVLITQGDAVGDSAATLDNEDVKASVAEGLDRLHTTLTTERKGEARTPEEVRDAVVESSPIWRAKVKRARGQFVAGEKARAQASVTVQDAPDGDGNPGMWLSVTWTEEVTLTTSASQAASK